LQETLADAPLLTRSTLEVKGVTATVFVVFEGSLSGKKILTLKVSGVSRATGNPTGHLRKNFSACLSRH
jgi:hypothetical protein